MSIPKKGSRLLSIAGQRYRWRVRNRPTYGQALLDSGLVLAVEIATPLIGSVLIANLPLNHPSNWLEQPGGSVTPALVKQIIQHALTMGWQPHCPGEQFRLDVRNIEITPIT
jgi:hypothetical protein